TPSPVRRTLPGSAARVRRAIPLLRIPERLSSGRAPASGTPLDVDGRVLGVALDELAPRLYRVAHERAERAVGRRCVLHGHLLQYAPRGIHGGLPELLRVHLSQTFVAL